MSFGLALDGGGCRGAAHVGVLRRCSRKTLSHVRFGGQRRGYRRGLSPAANNPAQ
jgi:predicted acylesterase/phospholipase RssA